MQSQGFFSAPSPLKKMTMDRISRDPNFQHDLQYQDLAVVKESINTYAGGTLLTYYIDETGIISQDEVRFYHKPMGSTFEGTFRSKVWRVDERGGIDDEEADDYLFSIKAMELISHIISQKFYIHVKGAQLSDVVPLIHHGTKYNYLIQINRQGHFYCCSMAVRNGVFEAALSSTNKWLPDFLEKLFPDEYMRTNFLEILKCYNQLHDGERSEEVLRARL